MIKNYSHIKGKIIRDAVHGDISIPENFLQIIDTPEFQRLRRIRQLSTAYMLFPTAEHTRFTHSIGTFHVMKMMIDHFTPILADMNIEIDQRDVQLALGVALLHDIGHGPFSHAFENALPNSNYKKMHEDWTTDIITSPASNIYKVLVKNFDSDFANDLAGLIKKEREVKNNKVDVRTSKKIDLFFILSSLISSQLDADRMDYLLRDSFFTGVPLGQFDISRLIKSLTITVHKDNFYVCVLEKYLPIIEDYLLARYQMHGQVYYHNFKCQMELVVKKILRRAYELYNHKLLEKAYLPEAIVSIFECREITVKEYIDLDDSVLISLFSKWKRHNDEILSALCTVFIDRKKYTQLELLDNTDTDIEEFKKELIEVLQTYNYKVTDLNDEYFWLENKVKHVIYKDLKDNIWVLRNNGTISDLFKIAQIVTEDMKGDKNMVFINTELLKFIKEIGGKQSAATDDIKNLVKLYNTRNHIEIEKKYIVPASNIFDKVLTVLKNWGEYEIAEPDTVTKQEDYYYDTDDKILYSSNKTLRIRDKGTNYILTVKTPTRKNSHEEYEEESQSQRFEYELTIKENDINNYKDYIVKYLPELKEAGIWARIQNTLTIKNDRKQITVSKNNVKFEMVFDDVEYKGFNDTSHQEYQIEMELKSDYPHRVNLKLLSDYLELNVPELKPTTESKYKRGLCLTN
jgi:hypothetical protein